MPLSLSLLNFETPRDDKCRIMFWTFFQEIGQEMLDIYKVRI